MDEELEHFKRAVDLVALAATLGYGVDPPNASLAATSVAMKNLVTGDKIVVRRDQDGHWIYFSVRDERDNGTVIDFLRWRRRFSLGRVRQELRGWLSLARRSGTLRPSPEPPRPRPAHPAVALRFEAARNELLPRYLATRGLLSSTVEGPPFRGTFRVEGQADVLFPHRCDGRVVGFEIKGPTYTGFASGGQKAAWTTPIRHSDTRLVIVEGAIDALSYHQLHPDPHAAYLSTAGAPGARQLEILRKQIAELPAATQVVIATDADAAGDRIAERIAGIAGSRSVRRHRPGGPLAGFKDWNDIIRISHAPRATTRSEKQLSPSNRHDE